MARIPIRIKHAVRAGNYIAGGHFQKALADDRFYIEDAIFAILNAEECDKLTDDPSNTRYLIYGLTSDGREIDVIVTVHQGTVIFKTAYEGHG